MSAHSDTLPPLRDRLKETFATYFKFGYTTFGGPAAHIAMLYEDIVTRRQWIASEQFTELFAICQALPGPASTELAYSLALVRSGFLCAILAFLLWSIPGAIVMTVAGVLIGNIKGEIPLWATRLEQGLASAAIGLVALAAYKMSTTLATDKLTRILALVAGSVSALYSAPWLLPVMMIAGGVVSYTHDAFLAPFYNRMTEKRKKDRSERELIDLKAKTRETEVRENTDQGQGAVEVTLDNQDNETPLNSNQATENTVVVEVDSIENQPVDEKVGTERKAVRYSKKLGAIFFSVFLVLLVASILARTLVPSSSSEATYGSLVSTFYFVGSIIFGGGPVIIPLLKTYTVDSGWMTDSQFLVGLAMIQSMPGPNFNFACFLGAVAMVNANKSGVAGAILCYLAIFLPGLLLKNAVIPFWQSVREHRAVKMVFRGVNACALGLVFSATWLLWTQTNALGGVSGYHAVIASAAFVGSGYLSIPAPLVIIIGGGMGAIEYAVSR